MLLAASTHLISTFQAIVLGLLQGVTELFPVSSLGHTVIFPNLFGWHNIVRWQSESNSPWLAFVVMLHVGSALGLLAYFWKTWLQVIRAFFSTLAKRKIETPMERLAWLIIAATIPVGILGLALQKIIADALAKPLAASIFLVVNGGILLAAQRYRSQQAEREASRSLDTFEYKEAVVVGVAQSTALIAGISRDGMTMTAGLLRGLDNADAARFAFLLATPPILLAGLLKFKDLTGRIHVGSGYATAQQAHDLRTAAVLAAIFAGVAAVFTVHFLTRWFEKRTLTPFGIYCVVFGAAMIAYNA